MIISGEPRGCPGRLSSKSLRRKLDSGVKDPEGVVPFPPTNWPIYTVNDEVVLDYIGRFENLNEHLHVIGERVTPINLIPSLG